MKPVRYNLYSKVFYTLEYNAAKLRRRCNAIENLKELGSNALMSRALQIKNTLKETTETHV